MKLSLRTKQKQFRGFSGKTQLLRFHNDFVLYEITGEMFLSGYHLVGSPEQTYFLQKRITYFRYASLKSDLPDIVLEQSTKFCFVEIKCGFEHLVHQVSGAPIHFRIFHSAQDL